MEIAKHIKKAVLDSEMKPFLCSRSGTHCRILIEYIRLINPSANESSLFNRVGREYYNL
jgi:hypothetical protein